ncbi:MAG TPA: tetratricopeptide repeat protein, partial [Vicinamibacteria bacterium]
MTTAAFGLMLLVAGSSGAAARPEALVSEGRKLLDAGRLEEARDRLEKAAAADPGWATPHLLLGRVHEARAALPAAAAAYERALRADPDLAEAHDGLGFVLGQLGQTRDAIDRFRRAAELRPDRFEAQYHLGATLW